MFEPHWDGLKRSMRAKGYDLKEVAMTMRNTDEYYTWMELYIQPENCTLEYTESEDGKTVTFYTMRKEATNA